MSEEYSSESGIEDTEDVGVEEEYTGPILPGGHRFDKTLVCVRYPGNVVNHEKAIETLGGIAEISEVFA